MLTEYARRAREMRSLSRELAKAAGLGRSRRLRYRAARAAEATLFLAIAFDRLASDHRTSDHRMPRLRMVRK